MGPMGMRIPLAASRHPSGSPPGGHWEHRARGPPAAGPWAPRWAPRAALAPRPHSWLPARAPSGGGDCQLGQKAGADLRTRERQTTDLNLSKVCQSKPKEAVSTLPGARPDGEIARSLRTGPREGARVVQQPWPQPVSGSPKLFLSQRPFIRTPGGDCPFGCEESRANLQGTENLEEERSRGSSEQPENPW